MPEETRPFRHELLGEIRTVLLDDVRWFNVMDLCDEHGITDAARAMKRLSNRDARQVICATEFGPWKMWFVTEEAAIRLAEKPAPQPKTRPERTSGGSPYRQIADSYRVRIMSGEFAPGDDLPSASDVACTWRVTPRTVQKAFRILSDEGLVTTRRGPGACARVKEDANV